MRAYYKGDLIIWMSFPNVYFVSFDREPDGDYWKLYTNIFREEE